MTQVMMTVIKSLLLLYYDNNLVSVCQQILTLSLLLL